MNTNLSLKILSITDINVVGIETYILYKGESIDKFPRALALLSHQIYSSHWGQLKAISILFEWGYDTLISNKR